MKTNQTTPCPRWMRILSLALLAGLLLAAVTACGHLVLGKKKPAAAEFGLGPRTSAQGLYTATLQPQPALQTRVLQTVAVVVRDAAGRPVEGAVIAVDGGMPQHGHGLPTKPRVGRVLEGGIYEIEGVRFNMGGWWEFTLAIHGAPGADRVTFNLAL
jgi:hypothetical protein